MFLVALLGLLTPSQATFVQDYSKLAIKEDSDDSVGVYQERNLHEKEVVTAVRKMRRSTDKTDLRLIKLLKM